MDFLADIRHFYAEIIEPVRGKPIGCSPEEVNAFEAHVGFPLPGAYRQYLLWMGQDYRGIFAGSDWLLASAIRNTRHLPDLLARNGVLARAGLPKHYLVFFGHQGYMAAWFTLPKLSDDPPVWFYSESGYDEPDVPMEAPVLEGTFTDFVLKDMTGSAKFLGR